MKSQRQWAEEILEESGIKLTDCGLDRLANMIGEIQLEASNEGFKEGADEGFVEGQNSMTQDRKET